MAELIVKEITRSGENVTYGVYFNNAEFGDTANLDSFEFVFNFPTSDFTYVSHEEGDVGTVVSNAFNVGSGQFNLEVSHFLRKRLILVNLFFRLLLTPQTPRALLR